MFARRGVLSRSIVAAAALLGVSLAPAGAADLSQASGSRASLFNIEAPTSTELIHNGSIYSLSGWTAGTRVDFYLDGPAGVGEGLGSAEVKGSRPDVARAFGSGLAQSGFGLAYRPLTLPIGTHQLYAYSLIDGQWVQKIMSIQAEGNVVPPDNPPPMDPRDDDPHMG